MITDTATATATANQHLASWFVTRTSYTVKISVCNWLTKHSDVDWKPVEWDSRDTKSQRLTVDAFARHLEFFGEDLRNQITTSVAPWTAIHGEWQALRNNKHVCPCGRGHKW